MAKLVLNSVTQRPEVQGNIEFTKECLYIDKNTEVIHKVSFLWNVESYTERYNRSDYNELIAEKLKQDFLAFANSQ